MTRKIHFISGLPRAGSTLLAAILRQNPRIHAAMSSPVGPIFNACLGAMGAENEFAVFLNAAQKRAILEGVFEGYYGQLEPRALVFDTGRMWTSRLPAIGQLFPEAKVIACVRSPAWVMDSVERLLRRNALDVSRIFTSAQERATVYSRADALLHPGRMIGAAWSALREAYYGEHSDRLLLVDYDLLASRPAEVLALIYRFLGEPEFPHDFSDVTYEAEMFDTQLLARGLHKVSGPVRLRPRQSVLPPDLFRRGQELIFWQDPAGSAAHRIAVTPEAEPLSDPAGG